MCEYFPHNTRSTDVEKCGVCEPTMHLTRVPDMNRDCGDRGFQWKCAICHSSASKLSFDHCKENILGAFNVLSEKFDMIFKVQLPKLNGELSQLKCTTDRIVKQNQDLMLKMDSIEKRKSNDKRPKISYSRRSKMIFKKVSSDQSEITDTKTMLSSGEKSVRFRTRRRPYIFNRMLLLLNRKLNKKSSVTPRRRRY